jgi:hypothetical protein
VSPPGLYEEVTVSLVLFFLISLFFSFICIQGCSTVGQYFSFRSGPEVSLVFIRPTFKWPSRPVSVGRESRSEGIQRLICVTLLSIIRYINL